MISQPSFEFPIAGVEVAHLVQLFCWKLNALLHLVNDMNANLCFRRDPPSRTRKQIKMRESVLISSERYIHPLERVERVRVL